MKKTFSILTIATTLFMFACGSDRTDNNGSDSMMNDTSTMDTATISTDSGSINTDTTSIGTGQISPDSTVLNP